MYIVAHPLYLTALSGSIPPGLYRALWKVIKGGLLLEWTVCKVVTFLNCADETFQHFKLIQFAESQYPNIQSCVVALFSYRVADFSDWRSRRYIGSLTVVLEKNRVPGKARRDDGSDLKNYSFVWARWLVISWRDLRNSSTRRAAGQYREIRNEVTARVSVSLKLSFGRGIFQAS